MYLDATKAVNLSLQNASMASQKRIISSKKKTDEESKISQVLNEQILYDLSVDGAQDTEEVSFSTFKSGVSGGVRPTSPSNFRKGNKPNIL